MVRESVPGRSFVPRVLCAGKVLRSRMNPITAPLRALLLAVAAACATPSFAATVYTRITAPGELPATLGPYPVEPFGDDPRPLGSTVTEVPAPLNLTYDRPVTLLAVGQGWDSWAGTYTGDLYFTSGNELGIFPPPQTVAFGFSLQPNLWDTFAFEVSANGTTVTLDISGDGDARFIGFWTDDPTEPISYVRIWDATGAADGFALGELTLTVVPEPLAYPLAMALPALLWAVWSRRPR